MGAAKLKFNLVPAVSNCLSAPLPSSLWLHMLAWLSQFEEKEKKIKKERGNKSTTFQRFIYNQHIVLLKQNTLQIPTVFRNSILRQQYFKN